RIRGRRRRLSASARRALPCAVHHAPAADRRLRLDPLPDRDEHQRRADVDHGGAHRRARAGNRDRAHDGRRRRDRLGAGRRTGNDSSESESERKAKAKLALAKYLVETYGCQMNQHDSERMAGLLEQAGYDRTDDDRDAEVIVISTCSVRERAEEKLYTRLGEIRMMGEESGAHPVVAVAGCVAQQEGEKLLTKYNGHVIDVLIGTQSLKMLPLLVADVRRLTPDGRSDFGGSRSSDLGPRVDLNPYDDVSFPLGVAKRQDPHRAYVTIIEGCNEFCAFCVVPYTRGTERMRPWRDIVADVRFAAETGAKEVQLLGQIVNHYQAPDDPHCDFAELLARVSDVAGIERIRFASPHPRHVTPRMIEAMRGLPKVCRHLHLPVQSGSSRVLQLMR